MLKSQFFTLGTAALLGMTAQGGPFDPTKVASDAKWVVHLDFEAFRNSSVGRQLIDSFFKPKLEQNEQLKGLNLSINLTNISGATAYGPAFEKKGEGVLLLSTTANVKKDLDTLVGMAALSEKETKDVEMVQQEPFPLYSFKEQVFFAPGVGGSVVIAKSRELLEQGREVALGKKDNLAKAEGFRDYPATTVKPFFLAMAEGFNDAAEIPPQAQVLRETRGGRLALGEKEENLFLNLVFKAKDDEASTKIQQVLQGIVALISMSQPDKEITELAANSKIASAGRNVSVDLTVPSKRALEKISEKHQHKDEAKPRRTKEKRPAKSQEEKTDDPQSERN